MQDSARKQVAYVLSNTLGFIDFTDEPCKDTLLISLEPLLNTPSMLREIGFRFSIRGSHVSQHVDSSVYWKMRDAAEFMAPWGSTGSFLRNLRNTFGASLQSQKDNLVTVLFSKMHICESALLLPRERVWVLPYTKDALRMDRESRIYVFCNFKKPSLEIQQGYDATVVGTKTPPDSATVPTEFDFGIAAVSPDQENIGDLTGGFPMTVKGLYVKKYVPLPTENPAPADSVSF